MMLSTPAALPFFINLMALMTLVLVGGHVLFDVLIVNNFNASTVQIEHIFKIFLHLEICSSTLVKSVSSVAFAGTVREEVIPAIFRMMS